MNARRAILIASFAWSLIGTGWAWAAPPSASDLVALCAKVKPAYVFISGGSGVVIHPDGLMLTNSHVIGKENKFDVRLGNGRHFRANVLGRDVTGDVAVLKLELKADEKVPHLELGDSDALTVGETALAVGNPFGLGVVDQAPTFTLGVISSLRQLQGQYTECIVTDAEVNPGNSGGPLLNMAGQVVGINGQISTRWGLRSNTGLSYAISARQIKIWLPKLTEAKGGEVAHGRLTGLQFESAEGDSPKSVVVKEVAEGSPAAEGGFKPGDAIIRWDGLPVPNALRLVSIMGMYPDGHDVTVDVRRGDQEMSLVAKLSKPRRGQLGLTLAKPGKDDEHVKIEAVEKDSVADKAGIQAGDQITAVEGSPLNVPVAIQFRLLDGWMKNAVNAGDVVELKLRRKNDAGEWAEKEYRLVPK